MKCEVPSRSEGGLIQAQPAHVSLRCHSFLCFPYPRSLLLFLIQLKQHLKAAFRRCHSPPGTRQMIKEFLSALLSCSVHNAALLLWEVRAASLPSFLRAASGKSGRIPEEKSVLARKLAWDLVHKQNFEDLNDFVTWHSGLFILWSSNVQGGIPIREVTRPYLFFWRRWGKVYRTGFHYFRVVTWCSQGTVRVHKPDRLYHEWKTQTELGGQRGNSQL